MTFEYGFNVELNAAFRKPTNDKNAKPEYAIRLEAQAGDDHPTATFEDGATELITEITSAELERQPQPHRPNQRSWPNPLRHASATKPYAMRKGNTKQPQRQTATAHLKHHTYRAQPCKQI